MDPLIKLCTTSPKSLKYGNIHKLCLCLYTPTLNFLACFKYIAHAPTTIETYTSSVSFQNLVHVYLRFVSKTRISLESYL